METKLFSYLGLALVYSILFPLRLKGLRNALRKQDYVRFLLAGLSLGSIFFSLALSIIMKAILFFPIMVWLAQILLAGGFIGVIGSLILNTLAPPPTTNTINNAIVSWLWTRLTVVTVLGIWNLISIFRHG